jgi:hypothetical protein
MPLGRTAAVMARCTPTHGGGAAAGYADSNAGGAGWTATIAEEATCTAFGPAGNEPRQYRAAGLSLPAQFHPTGDRITRQRKRPDAGDASNRPAGCLTGRTRVPGTARLRRVYRRSRSQSRAGPRARHGDHSLHHRRPARGATGGAGASPPEGRRHFPSTWNRCSTRWKTGVTSSPATTRNIKPA